MVFRTHSVSRYSVAALLGAAETDTRLIDLEVTAPLELSVSSLEKQLEQKRVILAYSVMSTQAKIVYEEIHRIRKRLGDRVIIMGGGAHASARPTELIENGFDYVIIGEGERLFPEALNRIINQQEIETIEGIVSKNSRGCPHPRSLSQIRLDNHPPFALKMNIVGPIEVTRGCPFSCKFCCTPFLTGNSVRHRSVDSVVYWLERAVRERGFKRTWFLSPNALCYGGRGRRSEIEKLEILLKRAASVEGLDEIFFGAFPSEVRPEFVTREILAMMREYVANKTLQIGIQSGSNRVLEIANRKHTVEEGLDAARIALDTGFIPHVDMIFGLPGEKEEDVDASIAICQDILDIGGRVHGHVFMPLPGSAFENMPPGVLSQETRQFLGELSRKKLLTGSWSHQEVLAEELAEKNTDIGKS